MNFRRLFIFVLIILNILIFFHADDAYLAYKTRIQIKEVESEMRHNLHKYIDINTFLITHKDLIQDLIKSDYPGYVLNCETKKLFAGLIMEDLSSEFNPIDLYFVKLEHIVVREDNFIALQIYSHASASFIPKKSPLIQHYLVHFPINTQQMHTYFEEQNKQVIEFESLRTDQEFYYVLVESQN